MHTSNFLRLAKADRTGGPLCFGRHSSPWFLFRQKTCRHSTLFEVESERLEIRTRNLRIARFSLKQSSVKWTAQMRELLSGLNSFLFIFKSHCFLNFEFAGNLNVFTFDLELLNSLVLHKTPWITWITWKTVYTNRTHSVHGYSV